MNAVITHKESLAPAICRVSICSGAPMHWRAGQYITLGAKDYEPRPYSIAARGAHDDVFDIHVVATGQGRLSDYLVHDAAVDDTVDVVGPLGGTGFAPVDGRDVVFVAGGTGLAPACAHIQNLGDRAYTLYHAVQGKEDFYAPQLGLTAIPVFSALDQADALCGFPHQAIDFTPHRDAVFYLAGPPQMVQACKETLQQLGVDLKDIFHD